MKIRSKEYPAEVKKIIQTATDILTDLKNAFTLLITERQKALQSPEEWKKWLEIDMLQYSDYTTARAKIAQLLQVIIDLRELSDLAHSDPDVGIISDPYNAAANGIQEQIETLNTILQTIIEAPNVERDITGDVAVVITAIEEIIDELIHTPFSVPYNIPSGVSEVEKISLPRSTMPGGMEEFALLEQLLVEISTVPTEPEPPLEQLDIPGVSWVVKKYPGQKRREALNRWKQTLKDRSGPVDKLGTPKDISKRLPIQYIKPKKMGI